MIYRGVFCGFIDLFVSRGFKGRDFQFRAAIRPDGGQIDADERLCRAHCCDQRGDAHDDVDLYLHQQGIDTTTPAGKMMFQMMGVFAEFERTMIQERIHAGLGRARAKGKALGRPKTLTPKQAAHIRALRAEGMSLRKIARQIGRSLGSVQRALAA